MAKHKSRNEENGNLPRKLLTAIAAAHNLPPAGGERTLELIKCIHTVRTQNKAFDTLCLAGGESRLLAQRVRQSLRDTKDRFGSYHLAAMNRLIAAAPTAGPEAPEDLPPSSATSASRRPRTAAATASPAPTTSPSSPSPGSWRSRTAAATASPAPTAWRHHTSYILDNVNFRIPFISGEGGFGLRRGFRESRAMGISA
jgi:hypothetical protein